MKYILQIYLKVTGREILYDDTKIVMLLNLIGENTVEMYSFTLTEADKEIYNKVVGTIKRYCIPYENVV